MIFRQWKQVLNGTKTQTRRPVYFTDYALRDTLYTHEKTDTNVAIYGGPSGNLKWETGRTYAVQPRRGKKAVGRIRITKIRREKLQDISLKDCDQELGTALDFTYMEVLLQSGFRSLWNSIYKKPHRWEDNPDVWVLEFELVND